MIQSKGILGNASKERSIGSCSRIVGLRSESHLDGVGEHDVERRQRSLVPNAEIEYKKPLTKRKQPLCRTEPGTIAHRLKSKTQKHFSEQSETIQNRLKLIQNSLEPGKRVPLCLFLLLLCTAKE